MKKTFRKSETKVVSHTNYEEQDWDQYNDNISF